MTNPVTTSSRGAAANPQRPAMELDSLRLLLLRAAESLCADDALQVEQHCNELDSRALQLRASFVDLFPNRKVGLPADWEQQRRHLLLPLLEARAFYLAALRRWRRSLRLRRSLLEMQQSAPTYCEAEVPWRY